MNFFDLMLCLFLGLMGITFIELVFNSINTFLMSKDSRILEKLNREIERKNNAKSSK